MIIKSNCWYSEHIVHFKLKTGIYENIIVFLINNNISFLTTMELDFTNIPINLHGKGNSKNLLDYLSKNNENVTLIYNFIEYFIKYITKIKYYNGKLINIYINSDDNWDNSQILIYEPYIPITTPIDWTYEGIMTVGRGGGEYTNTYGCTDGFVADFDFGELSPKIGIDYFLMYIVYDPLRLTIGIEDENADYLITGDITISIDGIEYQLIDYFLELEENPFPEGQTCEIKLRYTLAEPEPEPTYPEVTVGTQTWMTKNLDIDDGQGGIYAYDDDEDNVPIYGRLYIWEAAMRVAASIDGWHLPSEEEWQTLSDYLGGESVAGGKLKETGTDHWTTPNTGATNETGFTALPGGNRNYNGTFSVIGNYGYWWSATENNTNNAWYRFMRYNRSNVSRDYSNEELGFSVRLIKD